MREATPPPGSSRRPAPRRFLCSVLRPSGSHVGSCRSFTGATFAKREQRVNRPPMLRKQIKRASQASPWCCPRLDSEKASTAPKRAVYARQRIGRRSRPPSFEDDSSFGYARQPTMLQQFDRQALASHKPDAQPPKRGTGSSERWPSPANVFGSPKGARRFAGQ